MKSTRDDITVNAILEDMREGLSLRKACAKRGVKAPTFLLWVDGDKELAEQYARAREAMLDWQAEELEDIGDMAVGAESAVQVAGLRLKADNRKWLLSKLAPRKYGDKVAIGGAEDLAPINTVTRIELVALKPNKDDDDQG